MPRSACPRLLACTLAFGCGSSDAAPVEDGAGGDGTGGGSAAVTTDAGTDGPRSGADGAPAPCIDTCPGIKNGIVSGCKKRFVYGVNYAWHTYSGDFGGIYKWSFEGVSLAPDGVAADFAQLRDAGVDVIRWWMFGDLRGDGVSVDTSTGLPYLGTTVYEDVRVALALAASYDLHIQLTLFSFEALSWPRTDNGLPIVSLAPIVRDATKRGMLVENVVRPIARAATLSEHRDRLVSWDVINEPEWATSGNDGYGDVDFTPDSTNLDAVAFSEMQAFVGDIVKALHEESDAPVTVGGASVGWKNAWAKVGLDFYTLHMYGWINQRWPYGTPPSTFGLDKPVVMGEFPLDGMSGAPYAKFVQTVFDVGYAGALGWQFAESAWSKYAPGVKAFADAHPCITHY
jgi:hypothetical protein